MKVFTYTEFCTLSDLIFQPMIYSQITGTGVNELTTLNRMTAKTAPLHLSLAYTHICQPRFLLFVSLLPFISCLRAKTVQIFLALTNITNDSSFYHMTTTVTLSPLRNSRTGAFLSSLWAKTYTWMKVENSSVLSFCAYLTALSFRTSAWVYNLIYKPIFMSS